MAEEDKIIHMTSQYTKKLHVMQIFDRFFMNRVKHRISCCVNEIKYRWDCYEILATDTGLKA